MSQEASSVSTAAIQTGVPFSFGRVMAIARNTFVEATRQKVFLPDGSEIDFPIDGFARTCLINDVDELGYLLGLEEAILAYEKSSAV